MYTDVKDIRFKNIIGGKFIIGFQLDIRSGYVQIVCTRLIELLRVAGIDDTTRIYQKISDQASINLKVFEEIINLPEVKETKLISLIQKDKQRVIIGFEYEADGLNDGEVTVKELTKIEKFKNAGSGGADFVAYIM